MRKTFAALVAMAALLATAFIPSVANATPRQTLNLLGAVADANHPIGSVDPFTDVTIDGGQTWHPAIVSRQHPWVTVGGTNAWLNCQSNDPNDTLGSCSSTLPVHALFRYRFWVASDFANTTFTGHFDVDNEANVYLNGLDANHLIVGPLPGAQDTFVSEMSIQPLMVSGWNTMYVNLQDYGGLSGINYNLTIALDSDTAIKLASPGSQVNFDAQSGTVDPDQKTVAPGALLSSITFPTPTRAGYSFDGWFTAPTGGQAADAAYAQGLRPTNDLTLYARWTIVHYNVAYDEQGGSSVDDTTYTIGDTITLPAAPTKPGYTFDGWFTAPTGGTALGATAQLTGTGNISYFAHWTKIETPTKLPETGATLPPFMAIGLLMMFASVGLLRARRR